MYFVCGPRTEATLIEGSKDSGTLTAEIVQEGLQCRSRRLFQYNVKIPSIVGPPIKTLRLNSNDVRVRKYTIRKLALLL